MFVPQDWEASHTAFTEKNKELVSAKLEKVELLNTQFKSKIDHSEI